MLSGEDFSHFFFKKVAQGVQKVLILVPILKYKVIKLKKICEHTVRSHSGVLASCSGRLVVSFLRTVEGPAPSSLPMLHVALALVHSHWKPRAHLLWSCS